MPSARVDCLCFFQNHTVRQCRLPVFFLNYAVRLCRLPMFFQNHAIRPCRLPVFFLNYAVRPCRLPNIKPRPKPRLLLFVLLFIPVDDKTPVQAHFLQINTQYFPNSKESLLLNDFPNIILIAIYSLYFQNIKPRWELVARQLPIGSNRFLQMTFAKYVKDRHP